MKVQLAPGTTLTSIEGKDVLFSVRTGDSYGLNETAARMLRLGIEVGLEEAANQMAEEYSVEPSEIRADFDELMRDLIQLKLVQ
ncbi:MAG: PqqD family protein [Afipia sp.]|nr:PqqD family protein [Afipia sp.]